VKVLLDRGFRVFGSVRTKIDANRLQRELGRRFLPIIFDVTDEEKVRAAACLVRDELHGETLSGLVNNAGIAISGPALDLSIDDYRRQMEVNVIGQVIVTQAFAPLLGADPSLKGTPGRIVMIGSVSGKNGSPLLSPYCMSKHALEGFAESIRREFMLFGIDVIVIAPGAVKTQIWRKAEEADISRFRNSAFFPALQRIQSYIRNLGERGLPAEKVGELVHRVLTYRSPSVRYSISPEPVQLFVAGLLPTRVLDRIVAKRLGLLQRSDS
jgi:NAD(P)-dependent dehydrogenase (short-subunit alcohol dehydrogenase family)